MFMANHATTGAVSQWRKRRNQVRRSSWDYDGAAENGRKAAKEGDYGKPVEDERRNDGHEEQMLDHVGAEEDVGEAIYGRGDG